MEDFGVCSDQSDPTANDLLMNISNCSDSSEDGRYLDGGGGSDVLDTVSLNSVSTECLFEAPLLATPSDAEVATRFARIKSHDETDAGAQGVLQDPPQNNTNSTSRTIDAIISSNARNNRNSMLDDSDADDEEETFDHANVRYAVTVDVHSNRKDFKKLSLQHELKDTLSNTLEDNDAHIEEMYEQSSTSDSKSERSCEDNDTISFHHWDDADSKTSYEDVSTCLNSSDDEKLHMYFILDKKNMSAKQVEHEEYQNFLERSISLSKLSIGGGGLEGCYPSLV